MKSILTSMFSLVFPVAALLCSCNSAKMSQRAKANQDSVAVWWQSNRFAFHATNALLMSGTNVNLTSDYTFEIRNDSVIVWLPYFGRSFVAPTDPSQGGIKFATDNYTIKDKKQEKKMYKMTILPKGLPAFQNTKDVQQMYFTVSNDGYGTLQIQSLNRTPISFYGYLAGK